jgi:hypothetical protein
MTDAVETQAAEEPVQLSLGDIQLFVQIIDLCSKRGAFEGQELEPIGALRGKVVRFLESNVPAEEGAPVQGEMDVEPSEEEEEASS